MPDPTVVCRSCGQTASHAPDDPMALCPYCGAPLPATADVRRAQREMELQKKAAELPGVKRAEGLWVGADRAPSSRRGGWLVWIVLFAAAAAAAVVATWIGTVEW